MDGRLARLPGEPGASSVRPSCGQTPQEILMVSTFVVTTSRNPMEMRISSLARQRLNPACMGPGRRDFTVELHQASADGAAQIWRLTRIKQTWCFFPDENVETPSPSNLSAGRM
jgi:hypothetical protein